MKRDTTHISYLNRCKGEKPMYNVYPGSCLQVPKLLLKMLKLDYNSKYVMTW